MSHLPIHIRPYKGTYPGIADTAYVDLSAVVIGRVKIGEDSSVWPCAVIRGDVHDIEIGARTNIQDGCVIHATHDGVYTPGGLSTFIGDDVTLGHNATIHACKIGNACLIGMNAVVLDGALVHDKVIVAAGAVVGPGKELESGFLWRGSPIRKARELSDKELEFLEYSAKHYIKLKNEYMQA